MQEELMRAETNAMDSDREIQLLKENLQVVRDENRDLTEQVQCEKTRISQMTNEANVMNQKYNKVKKVLFDLKDKTKSQVLESNEAIEDLKKLTDAHSKLQDDYSKLQKSTDDRYKVLNKRYKKT